MFCPLIIERLIMPSIIKRFCFKILTKSKLSCISNQFGICAVKPTYLNKLSNIFLFTVA